MKKFTIVNFSKYIYYNVTMIQDLQFEIKTDLEKIQNAFLSDGTKWFKKYDNCIISNDDKYIISFFPELLTFMESNGSTDYVANVWIGCRIMLHDKNDDHKQYCEEFLKYIETLGLKTFEDSNAFCKNFSVNKKEEFTTYICYFNPDFPQGKKTDDVLC